MRSRSGPFSEIERIIDRMSEQFGDRSDALGLEDAFGEITGGGTMPVDLVERPDEFVATVDLPGFESDDVDVRVTDHSIRISATVEESMEEEGENYLKNERHRRSLHRSITLPDVVETENVSATMKHGVLTVTLPRHEISDAKRVEID